MIVSDMLPRSETVIRTIILLLLILACIVCRSPEAAAVEIHDLGSPHADVHYDASLDVPAQDVARHYPGIKTRLEEAFRWQFLRDPKIRLVKERKDFLRMAGNPLTVAFASPGRNLIVIDQSKMTTRPFTMQSTLEHELCHILLHQHIDSTRLPRWLDEGLCQWASNSIDEMVYGQKGAALRGVALSQRAPPLGKLGARFPTDTRERLLAYEASKRFTAFIIGRYGEQGMIGMLKRLETGQDVSTAVLGEFSVPLGHLERDWHDSLRRRSTWFTFLGHYLYEILFALMAIISVYGFIRLRIQKRRYRDDDEDWEDAFGEHEGAEDNLRH